ncbi:hypothetical protein ACWGFX_11695 [Streptomyces xanthophaeus]
MNKWGSIVGVTALALLAVGCGSGKDAVGTGAVGEGGTPGARSGDPAASALAAPKPSQKTGELGADPGTRYTRVAFPQMEQLTCDEGDGGFRYGSGHDMRVSGVDELPARKDSTEGAEISCFGFPRIKLSKGTRTAVAPDLVARTKLFDDVADPKDALEKAFEKSLPADDDDRVRVGGPTAVTTETLVMKCQENVADSFPMTTCLWANYGAVGAIDYFPPGGEHFSMHQAVERTKEFVGSALKAPGGAS